MATGASKPEENILQRKVSEIMNPTTYSAGLDYPRTREGTEPGN
jgi:hypothetical protein